jgi:hypothetical protein
MNCLDQDKFDLFAKHLESIDDFLQNFADKHGLVLEKNTYRSPCRILGWPKHTKATKNLQMLIDISMDDDWLKVEYDENLPHTFAVVAYYIPPIDAYTCSPNLWRLYEHLAEHLTFSTICQHLDEYLETALQLLKSWTPDVITQRGEFFKDYYCDGNYVRKNEREWGLCLRRPDQTRFDLFVEHFETIDPQLQIFADKHGFTLEYNLHRQPCRILRRRGNPELVIGINMDDHWLYVEYSEKLPHSFGIATYYEPPADNLFVYRLRSDLAKQQTFSDICLHIDQYLETSAQLLQAWTPDIIMQDGECIKKDIK